MSGQLWEVVGGSEAGGILVREGRDTASGQLPERLSTGSVVSELGLEGDRLHYKRLTGLGPATGWVSTKLKERKLLTRMWEVVGGADSGGILVRDGRDTASVQLPQRLATGGLLRELAVEGDRLQYKLLSGSGPETGWVSCTFKSKPLLTAALKLPTGFAGGSQKSSGSRSPNSSGGTSGEKEPNPYEILGVPPDATDAVIKSAFRKLSLKVHPDHCPDDPEAPEKFRLLTEVKNFLLDPVKRHGYNLRNGLLQRMNVKWWVDWQALFDEIDFALEDSDEKPETEVSIPAALRPTDAPVEILLVGGTGLVGMVACTLLKRPPWDHTWAIAGRDESKLKKLEEKVSTYPNFRGAMCFKSSEDLERLAQRARVVVDFTGPKWQSSEAIVQACVKAKTHYVDTTGAAGDVLSVKQIRDRFDAAAQAAGVALLFFCGWCSVMVDFGVLSMVRHLRTRHSLPTRRVDAYRWLGNWPISGTHQLAFAGRDSKHFKEICEREGGVYLFGGMPPGGRRDEDEDEKGVVQDKYAGMCKTIDNIPDNVVPRCSYSMLRESEPYGDNFLYKNWMLEADRTSANFKLMGNAILRSSYDMMVKEEKIARPGQGPKERVRRESSCSMVFVGEADEPGDNPRKAHCVLRTGPGGLGDPFECTATMALEAASCVLASSDGASMASGPTSTALRAGFGTPAFHLAHLGFLERLAARGVNFQVIEGIPSPELFQNIVAASLSIAQ